MSAPDVYEELGRLVQTHQDREESNPPSAYAALAYLTARELVEFLRWRSAREEWPAEGCTCTILLRWWYTDHRKMATDSLQLLEHWARGKAATHDANVMVLWRYALGPCPCRPVPAGEEPKT